MKKEERLQKEKEHLEKEEKVTNKTFGYRSDF